MDPQDQVQDPTADWDPDDPRPWREHTKQLTAELKAERQAREERDRKLQAFERREAFDKALGEAGIEGVAFEDVPADVKASEITPTLLKVRAEEKAQARAAAETQTAKDLGFESVEEFRTFRAEREAARTQAQQSQQAVATVATTATTQSPAEKSAEEKAWEAHAEARKRGLSPEEARAIYARTLMEGVRKTG